MVDNLNNTHKVKQGECAWKVAKDNLKKNGEKVSNANIVREMNRLANINGCDSVDDFNKKFFSSTGLEFLINENDKPASEGGQTDRTPNESLVDSLSIDSTTVNKNKLQIPISTPTDTTKINKTSVAKKPPTPVQTAQEIEIARINNLPNDTARIIEYNKKNYDHQYYGILDKKTCQLKIYDRQGNIVKTFTVGVGKKKGDNLGTYYQDRYYKTKDAWRAEQGRYTTAGEFTLDDYKKADDAYIGNDGKPKIMALKGDNKGVRAGQMSIHILPRQDYNRRKAAIDSPALEDNRMSYGCVNLTEEDYDIMHSYLGEGNKIYILPEEQGNKLLLEEQKDGSYRFEQQYHKKQKRGVSKETASEVVYDVRPENNPVYIAEQKKKAEQERLLAQQKVEQPKENEFVWYNPFSWFS